MKQIQMGEELKVNLNVSGIPASWIPEIDKISDIRSKAVVTLIAEALEARRRKAGEKAKKGA